MGKICSISSCFAFISPRLDLPLKIAGCVRRPFGHIARLSRIVKEGKFILKSIVVSFYFCNDQVGIPLSGGLVLRTVDVLGA